MMCVKLFPLSKGYLLLAWVCFSVSTFSAWTPRPSHEFQTSPDDLKEEFFSPKNAVFQSTCQGKTENRKQQQSSNGWLLVEPNSMDLLSKRGQPRETLRSLSSLYAQLLIQP